MIAAVSLRLLYLIFQQVLGLVLLMGRTSSTRDVELLILRHSTSPTICRSRVVSWASAWASSRGGVVRAVSWAISRRVSPGDSRASPPATSRMPRSSWTGSVF